MVRMIELAFVAKRGVVKSARVSLALSALALSTAGCTRDARANAEAIYDETSGRLVRLEYDSDRDGRADAVAYMDGPRVIRIEVDRDRDGHAERREYYGANQHLERVELSTDIAGAAIRIERYENDILTAVEQDTSGDGRIDKWEFYDAGRLASVAFDTMKRGAPDRRLVYGPDGTARLELDTSGTGRFVPKR
jgi:hypothetical protein